MLTVTRASRQVDDESVTRIVADPPFQGAVYMPFEAMLPTPPWRTSQVLPPAPPLAVKTTVPPAFTVALGGARESGDDAMTCAVAEAWSPAESTTTTESVPTTSRAVYTPLAVMFPPAPPGSTR